MAKTGIRFNRSQLDFLKKSSGKLSKASAKAISNTGKIMLGHIKGFASYKALSPSSLAMKNHPYARRHGKIKKLSDRPIFAVGKETGLFVSSIVGKTTNQYEYAISYNSNSSTKRIVQGTRVMLPRNPIKESFETDKMKNLFIKTIKNEFVKAMK